MKKLPSNDEDKRLQSGDAAPYRRLWASVLMHSVKASIQDRIRSIKGEYAACTKLGHESAAWVESKSFREVAAMAGIENPEALQSRMVEKMKTLDGCTDILRIAFGDVNRKTGGAA